MASPIEQFAVTPLVPIEIAGHDVSFTNSALFMAAAATIITVLMTRAMEKKAMVPDRWQSVAELAYEFVATMVRDNAGHDGMKYFPAIFTLFMFVLLGNLMGMLPYSFTFTSHIIVTAAMAVTIFLGVTVLGFVKHGAGYLRMFFPTGAPIFTAPILIPIEIISYLSRPFSLSVRLCANMTAGHIMLKVMGGFVVMMSVFGILPFALVVGITVLEIGIAILQAYIFTVLTCIYLHDALHPH